MEIYNGIEFSSNYERAVASFIGARAKRPEQVSRQAAYDFISDFIGLIGTKPQELGFKPTSDIWFKSWEQQKERQNDVKLIHTTLNKVEALIKELYDLSLVGEVNENGFKLPDNVKPKRTLGKALAILGVGIEKGQLVLSRDCAAGLKELAEISKSHTTAITDSPIDDKEYFYFAYCVFEPESDWLIESFDKLLQANGSLIWLCQELKKRGYKQIDCKDGKRLSLDFVKQVGRKEEPVKVSWADKTHLGIEVTFEDLRIKPYFIWLRVPMFKTVLEKAS